MNEPKYRKITIDIEDGNIVTHIEKDNEEFLKQYYKIQSNWNSLREWLEEQNKFYEVSTMGYSYGVICNVLDKMNELESGEK